MPAVKLAHVANPDSIRVLLLNQLRAYQRGGFEVHAVCSPHSGNAEVERHGIPVHEVAMPRTMASPLTDARALVQMIALYRRERFSIVHTHGPKPGILGQLAAKLAGVPVILNTVHGYYFTQNTPPLRRRFLVALERMAGRCSDMVLSQNREDIETAVRERICTPDRIAWLGNGVDLVQMDPSRYRPEDRRATRRELGIPGGHLVVGMVGAAVREKGMVEFLHAARRIIAAGERVSFLVIGALDTGKPDSVDASVVDELELRGHVRLLGWRRDIPDLLSVLDVYTLPSYREGFPRSAIEAAAMEVPAIVTDIRGCREVVDHGVTGLLVPPGDANALAEALLRLLRDVDLRRRMGQAGRTKALREFDEQRVVERVLDTYHGLLAAKRLPTPEAATA